MNYTETPSRTRFHDFVKTLSPTIPTGFVPIAGTVRLYSNPKAPGMCFKPIDTATGGRGLRGLAFVTGTGLFSYALGKSLDHVAENWPSDGSPTAFSRVVIRLRTHAGDYLSTSRSEIAYHTYTYLVAGQPNLKKPYTVTIEHRLQTELLSIVCDGKFTFTHVMEVVGNYDAGMGALCSASRNFETMIEESTPGQPLNFLASTLGDSSLHGYVGREIGFGKSKSLLADPKIRAAVIAQYPDNHGIRGKAAELYAASLASMYDVEVKLAVYHDMTNGRLSLKVREGLVLDRGPSQVTAGSYEEMPGTVGGTTPFPPEESFVVPRNTVYQAAANFGDISNDAVKSERWFLRTYEHASLLDVSGTTLGVFDMTRLQQTMLPLLTSTAGTVPFDLDTIELTTQLVTLMPNPNPLDTAASLNHKRASSRGDAAMVEAHNARNVLTDNFHVVVLEFLDILDTKVRDALA